MRVKSLVVFFASGSLLALLASSPTGCASDTGSPRSDDDGPPPTPFVPNDASTDGSVQRLLCATSECPAGTTTCASSRARCDIDLTRDRNNCGACGKACPPDQHRNPWEEGPSLEVAFRCVDSKCAMFCQGGFGDCNGIPDDGCETDLSAPESCGACGVVCPAGTPCFDGACACPPPKVPCDGQCVDLNSDAMHCGRCGNECLDPTPPPFSHNLEMQCVLGECKRACRPPYGDCNGDPSDGCEKNLGQPDDRHCGACNNACPSGTPCDVRDPETFTMQCGCTAGLHKCPMTDGTFFCVDVITDPTHCGGCDVRCPSEDSVFARPVCAGSLCSVACKVGHADCNGFAADGCEIDLETDPRNCGACGTECDLALGQPCVKGKCVEADCGHGGNR